jgi:hypothetical protein
MQNPGSDAGVFVLGRRSGQSLPRDARRNVTLKKDFTLARDIPVMHTTLQIYDGVC